MTIDDRPAGPKAAARARPMHERDSAAATARLIAGYLAFGAALLAVGGRGAIGAALALLHLAVAACVLVIDRGRARSAAGAIRILADWLPLVLVPALYAELPLLMEALPGPIAYHDPWIRGLEESFFGAQPAYSWAAAWPIGVLSETLHASYVSYYPLIYLPPLLLYLGVSVRTEVTERSAAFHDTVFALVLCFILCFTIFVVFPVQGPRYLGVPEGVPDGPVRRLVLSILERGSSRGAAFPSSHVAVAVTQALLALKHQRGVGIGATVITVGLGAGAVYGGFHYGVDALAGVGVGASVALLAPRAARILGSGVKAS